MKDKWMVVVFVLGFNNGVIITWVRRAHSSNYTFTLPVSYTTYNISVGACGRGIPNSSSTTVSCRVQSYQPGGDTDVRAILVGY